MGKGNTETSIFVGMRLVDMIWSASSFFLLYFVLNNTSQAVKAIRRTNPRDKIKLLRKNYQQNEGQDGPPIMSSTMNNIRKEIAIMKKCRHMNLAHLVEVIDDPQADKIYMGE